MSKVFLGIQININDDMNMLKHNNKKLYNNYNKNNNHIKKITWLLMDKSQKPER